MTNEEWLKSLDTCELASVLDDLRACGRCRKNGNSCFPQTMDAWLINEHGGCSEESEKPKSADAMLKAAGYNHKISQDIYSTGEYFDADGYKGEMRIYINNRIRKWWVPLDDKLSKRDTFVVHDLTQDEILACAKLIEETRKRENEQ